jgi:DNA/RNA endonuclease YhcR with UshA esterase domain
MKKVLIVVSFLSLFLILIQPVSYANAQQYISPEDAYKHISETQTVCGTVASTFYSVRGKGQPTFINLDKPYPNQIFTIVIWGSDRHKFKNPPEIFFKEKRVCVTGTITTYRGKPQIVVKNSSQIELKK